MVPKAHYENLYDLEDPAALDIHRLTRRIAIVLKEVFDCDGTSTRQHNEPAGNQNDLWHLHVHVFPRFEGDNLYGSWYRDSTYEERLDFAARLQAAVAQCRTADPRSTTRRSLDSRHLSCMQLRVDALTESLGVEVKNSGTRLNLASFGLIATLSSLGFGSRTCVSARPAASSARL